MTEERPQGGGGDTTKIEPRRCKDGSTSTFEKAQDSLLLSSTTILSFHYLH